MQNSPMLISIKDPAGQYQFINKTFESLFGLEQSAVIGKTDTQIFPETIAVIFEKMHFDVLHKKSRVEAEERITSAISNIGLRLFVIRSMTNTVRSGRFAARRLILTNAGNWTSRKN